MSFKEAPSKAARLRTIKKVLKIALLVLILLGIAGAGAGAAVLANYLKDLPPFDHEKLKSVETSYLYDREGREVAQLHGAENRIVVSLDEIPEHVQKAFIAVEDERFYRHFGIDIWGGFRALAANLQHGGITQGSSTITMQLARNAFFSFEQTYKRKIQEAYFAILIERSYHKDEILEMYLNRIFFGNNAYGVEAAAQTYFKKTASALTLAEGAMLAGIVNSPNYNNPLFSEEVALSKMQAVLATMQRVGFIGQEEYDAAMAQELAYGEPPSIEFPHPWFVDYVVHHELLRLLLAMPQFNGDISAAYDAIYSGGLRIYTTMNVDLQVHVAEVLNRPELYPRTVRVDMSKVREEIQKLPGDKPEVNLSQTALQRTIVEEDGRLQPQASIVLADPQTGEILALGGGREYSRKTNQVLRFTSTRQCGSAIKPIVTYGPAFEQGILAGASSAVDDSPYILGDWTPENFDYKYRGLITVRDALYLSYNLPAVRVFEQLTPQVGTNYGERMGLTTLADVDRHILSVTLGGFTRGVTVLDMTQAYSILANEGIRMDLFTVRRIEDRQGNIIYEQKANPRQILSPQSTFLVTDILRDMVRHYLAKGLDVDNRPIAAKTGTTNDWRDVYLVAYTPNLVASFWMGYDEPRMGGIQQGWSFSTVFLREVFKEAFKTLPKMEFEKPPGIVEVEVCTKSGLLPTDLCRAAGTVKTDYFLATHNPRLNCDLHVTLPVCGVTGMRAGAFCPPDGIQWKLFLNRPPFIATDERWKFGAAGRKPEDAKDMPPEICPHSAEVDGDRPPKPEGFTASVAGYTISLEWRYNWNVPVREFRLFRQREGELQARFVAAVDSYMHSYMDVFVLEPGIEYTYHLVAVGYNGAYSNRAEVRVRGEDRGQSRKPEDLHAAYADGAVNLTWRDGNTYSDEFVVERKGNGPGDFHHLASIPGNQLSLRDSEVKPGESYQYRVYAVMYGMRSGPAQTGITLPRGAGGGNGNGGNGNGNGNGTQPTPSPSPTGGALSSLFAFLGRLIS